MGRDEYAHPDTFFKGLVILPVIARDCAWEAVDWLKQMNVRPGKIALTELELNDAFTHLYPEDGM